MVINNIKVYARLKNDSNSTEKWCDILTSSKDDCEDLIFHKLGKRENHSAYRFRFNRIFDDQKGQKEMFDTVAKPVVKSVLQGFNGTVFAYGQTGSGKTYTMTGSTKKYEERGIIPRSLQYIFSTIEKIEEKPTLYISYMEIYNEICYDLLSPRDHKTATRLEELPRVIVLENNKEQAHLRNLSVLPVSTEEEAMRLLFLGDTNRAIAETPLNEYSSRSHCIFTIHIKIKHEGDQNTICSKLNLVDLAGSERVHKSKITGDILNEAKHINLSLHFLQQVILALSESKRAHIPYRNSLMTFILKDSLAGNCLTVMLATLALSRRNIQETISTCKFAQRVSLIKTNPVINEVSDPHQEILLLKNEIQELQKQLANKQPNVSLQPAGTLSIKEKGDIENKINNYLKSSDNSFNIDIDPGLYQHCFLVFKDKIKRLEDKLEQNKGKEESVNQKHVPINLGVEGKSFDNEQKINALSHLNDDISLQEMCIINKENSEIDYYMSHLSSSYEKAKLLASIIEECQVNINYLREKLNVVSRAGDCEKKRVLSSELEHQQQIYRNSLNELRELKNETMQLEAGLKKAKAKMMLHVYNPSDRKHSFNIARERELKHTSLGDHTYSPLNEGYSRKFSHQEFEYLDKRFLNNCVENPALYSKSNSLKQNVERLKNDKCCNWNHQVYQPICQCCFQNNEEDTRLDSYNRIYEFSPHFKNSRRFNIKSDTDYEENVNVNCDYDCFYNNICLPPINNSMTSTYKKYKDKCCQKSKICEIDICPESRRQSNVQCCIDYCMSSTVPSQEQMLPNLNYQITDNERTCKFVEQNALSVQSHPECCLNSEIQYIPNRLSRTNSDGCLKIKDPEISTAMHSPIYQEESGYELEQNDNENTNITIHASNCINEECEKIGRANISNKYTQEVQNASYEIFLDSDTEDFRRFMGTIPLTGIEDIDKDISSFYRSKMCF